MEKLHNAKLGKIRKAKFLSIVNYQRASNGRIGDFAKVQGHDEPQHARSYSRADPGPIDPRDRRGANEKDPAGS